MFGSELKARWPLDPGCTYLNHGTVGVTPHAVLDVQHAIRLEIERQPAKFMDTDLRPRLRRAADRVGEILGDDPDAEDHQRDDVHGDAADDDRDDQAAATLLYRLLSLGRITFAGANFDLCH